MPLTRLCDAQEEMRGYFRNISAVMDCVGCEKCRLWGKLQVLGLATALKVSALAPPVTCLALRQAPAPGPHSPPIPSDCVPGRPAGRAGADTERGHRPRQPAGPPEREFAL